MSSGYTRVTKELDIKVIDTEKRPTAVERTEDAIRTAGWGRGRINQARAFIKRAKKSDARRRAEKAARKRNRGQR